MADEEKTTAEELAAQESTDAIAAPIDGRDLADDAGEAVEAIAKNVQERAAEIEDVLADASKPAALVKEESAESADASPAVEQLMEAPEAKGADAPHASDGKEPNLQISVGGERVRISTAHPMIEEIAEQLNKSRQLTIYSVGGLSAALLGASLSIQPSP